MTCNCDLNYLCDEPEYSDGGEQAGQEDGRIASAAWRELRWRCEIFAQADVPPMDWRTLCIVLDSTYARHADVSHSSDHLDEEAD